MRLLYVEDNPANLFLVQRIARMGNHEVIHYSDGQTALDGFEKDNPDLVLMDVQLPGKLNGLEVVKLLRQRGHKTPIVAVTAYAMVGDRERCLEAGCDSYISKPLPVAELVELIKRFDPQSTANLAKATAAAEPSKAAVNGENPAVKVEAPAENRSEPAPTEAKTETASQPTSTSENRPTEVTTPPAEVKSEPSQPDMPAPTEKLQAEAKVVPAAQPEPAVVTVQETTVVADKQPEQSG